MGRWVCGSVDGSVGRWAGRSVGRWVGRWVRRRVGGAICRWVGWSVGRWVGRGVGRWVGRSGVGLGGGSAGWWGGRKSIGVSREGNRLLVSRSLGAYRPRAVFPSYSHLRERTISVTLESGSGWFMCYSCAPAKCLSVCVPARLPAWDLPPSLSCVLAHAFVHGFTTYAGHV